MLLKNILLLLVIFITEGKWKIEKVTTQLFTQTDNRLLEERTYITEKEMSEINGRIPLLISLTAHRYMLKFQSGPEQGIYRLNDGALLLQQEGFPDRSYAYRLKPDSSLELDMPASYYKDNKRNLAVKLVYTCYYSKQ